jgi:hypothetical protein
MKIGLREFHSFVTTQLVRDTYQQIVRYRILSEMDLQCFVWSRINNYLQKDSQPGRFSVCSAFSAARSVHIPI